MKLTEEIDDLDPSDWRDALSLLGRIEDRKRAKHIAVDVACFAARRALPRAGEATATATTAIEAAEAWLADPSEERRRAAEVFFLHTKDATEIHALDAALYAADAARAVYAGDAAYAASEAVHSAIKIVRFDLDAWEKLQRAVIARVRRRLR